MIWLNHLRFSETALKELKALPNSEARGILKHLVSHVLAMEPLSLWATPAALTIPGLWRLSLKPYEILFHWNTGGENLVVLTLNDSSNVKTS